MANLWITPSHENTWLEMMTDRNLTSHTYRDQTAQAVVVRLQNAYVNEFSSILEAMKKAR